jgi:hypothetical protein
MVEEDASAEYDTDESADYESSSSREDSPAHRAASLTVSMRAYTPTNTGISLLYRFKSRLVPIILLKSKFLLPNSQLVL